MSGMCLQPYAWKHVRCVCIHVQASVWGTFSRVGGVLAGMCGMYTDVCGVSVAMGCMFAGVRRVTCM